MEGALSLGGDEGVILCGLEVLEEGGSVPDRADICVVVSSRMGALAATCCLSVEIW